MQLIKALSLWVPSTGKVLPRITKKAFLSAIGYVPSFLPKSSKPRPKLLQDEASWNKLVKDVHEYRENCKKKNKGKGQVPAFTISLTDTSNGDGKENKKVSTYSLYNISIF